MKQKHTQSYIHGKGIAVIFIFIFLPAFIFINFLFLPHGYDKEDFSPETGERFIPKQSAFWADLELTNTEINNTWHYWGDNITIEGRLWDDPTPFPGYDVAILIDGTLYPSFSNTTVADGNFSITFEIPSSLSYFTDHIIKVNVTETTPGEVDYINQFNIKIRATSHIDIAWANSGNPDLPYLTGERFNIDGYLRRDDDVAISTSTINKYLYNASDTYADGTMLSAADGRFPLNSRFNIPETPSSIINLKLNYSGVALPDPQPIDATEFIIPNIRLFRNITIQWSLEPTVNEDEDYTIAGRVVSRTNDSIAINNRQFQLRIGGSVIRTITTDNNGYFSTTYDVQVATGNYTVELRLETSTAKLVYDQTQFEVLAAGVDTPAPVETENDTPPPFQNFFVVFIPLLAGIIGALVFFGIRYVKKQEEESRVVNIPLEDKFSNLKILKESGRLEEALSYLFNAIYMELVSAKYGRTKKASETIRDMAIVSVTELKLPPGVIYPFITKIEEVIYARPYKISDKDFYDSVDLFSPVYHELTGYNFAIKF